MIPFVGREREQAFLLGAWQRARAGEAAYVLVHGEAGAGKTRLVDELGAGARADGGWVLRGRCWDLGGAPSYWPWIQAFGSLVDEAGEAAMASLLREIDPATLPALLRLLPRLRASFPTPLGREDVGGEAAEARLQHAVVALLGRVGAERPLLLVLDDLEAADLPSVRLLRFLLRSGRAMPLLLLALHRTPGPPDAPAGPALASLASEPAVARLRVGGLAETEIGQMMAAVMGAPVDEAAAAAVHARSGGNALFAVELIRLLTSEPRSEPTSAPAPLAPPAQASPSLSPLSLSLSPLPSGIRGIIEQRLGGLPAECRALLDSAAVAGHEVELDVLAAVTGLGEGALLAALHPALASAELVPVRERPQGYAFAHPLIRECLYEALPAGTRAELHGRFGDALRARHAGALDEHLDVIASHYVAALPVGWAPRALEHCRLAARRAAGLGARDECVRLLLLALEALPAIEHAGAERDDEPESQGAGQLWCELSLEVAEAQDRAGRVRDARATFMRVAEHAERAGLPRAFARAAVGYGGRFIWARPTGDAREVPMLERAYASLGDDAPALRAVVLARRSILRRDLAGADAILAGCRRATELARGAGDATAFAQTMGALVFALACLGSTEECLAVVEELAAAARANGDLEQTVQATVYRASCLLERGDPDGADAQLVECERLEASLRQPVQRWLRQISHAEIAFFRGRFEEAERRSDEARRIGQELGRPESAAIDPTAIYLGRREQGRVAEVEAMVRQARAEMPTFAIARCLPGHLDGQLDRVAEARAFLDRHLASGFADLLETSTYRMVLGLLAETAARTEHAAAAAALAPLLAPVTQRYLAVPGTAVLGPTARFRGLLAATTGAWPEAARLFREAAAESRGAGAACWALRCELELAHAILAGGAGEPAEGRALVTAVKVLAEASGFGDVEASARRLQERFPGGSPEADPSPPTFRREGEQWTIVYGGVGVRVRDGKGLRYLAALLARQGEDLSVVALASHADADADGDATAGPDEDDRAALERRLEDLDEEIEESARWNDLERGERARREREELGVEVAAALGLGGADRRAGASAERARFSVTKAIRSAIRRIAVEHAVLGRHLETTVRTGLYCRYLPDPLHPPRWHVEP